MKPSKFTLVLAFMFGVANFIFSQTANDTTQIVIETPDDSFQDSVANKIIPIDDGFYKWDNPVFQSVNLDSISDKKEDLESYMS